MNKYTFKQEYTDEYDQVYEVKHTFYADTHDEIAERFNEFLRGAGFIFNPNESYQLVPDETDVDWYKDEDEPESQWDNDEWEESFEEENTTETYMNDLDHSAGAVWPFPTTRPQEGTEFPNWGGEKCPKCAMTREQMGQNVCWEATGCGLGLNPTITTNHE
jgi:hypothetical protein